MKILIVDDSMNMLRTLANMLRVIGFESIERADNGENALIKLRNDNYDFICCDWNMPVMTGVEVLRAVRDDERLKNLPFLMITAEIDQNTVAEAGEVAVDGYLLKPFTMESLKAKIDEIMAQKSAANPVDIHLATARVYMDARQYDQAVEELKKAIKMNPKSPRISHALGQIYEIQGDLKNAQKFYARSVEFGHQFLKGYESLARVLEETGDMVGAVQNLKRAVRISPKNIDRQLNLSHNLVKTGQTEEAQKVLKNVVNLAEKDKAEVSLKVGEAFLEMGMAAEAQVQFAQALENDPKAILLYNRMGIALRRQKKFQEAVENYRKAISLDPENEALYYNLARAYYEAKDKSMAIQTLRNALKLDPEFEEAKKFLNRLNKD
jgi:tetratricopeptide (TPR) repeat protein